MGRILHLLFALLASVTRQDLARQVAYLKEETRIPRARPPERLVATDLEKRRLLRFGKKLGHQLKELISIVTYESFLRWSREAETAHMEKSATPGSTIRRFRSMSAWGNGSGRCGEFRLSSSRPRATKCGTFWASSIGN